VRDGDEAGSIGLTAVLLLPIVLIVFAAVLELGSLRVTAARARHAADLAVLVAVNDQDAAELGRSGRLVPAADAAAVARTYFSLNLAPLAPVLAGDAAAIAQAAVVTVRPGPPASVRLEAQVPVRTPFFAALLGDAVTPINVRAAAAAR
jgi:hypothetical protein